MENWHMSIKSHYDDYKNKWWGYLHTNRSLQVKRYFGPEDITEAHDSPFVDAVAGPWECSDREEAIEKLKKVLKGL